MILALYGTGCYSAAEITVEPKPASNDRIVSMGIDSAIVAQAQALADSALINEEENLRSRTLKREGLLLAALGTTLADSTLAFVFPPTDADSLSGGALEASIRSFNAGATVLEAYASAPTDVRANALLAEAQTLFEDALRANPFDQEARYWLARTYTVRASFLGEAELHAGASDVLRRLFAMHQNRHDYAALLAQSLEAEKGFAEAVKLWLLAATIAVDDAAMPNAVADSAAIFTYYVRGARAAIKLLDSEMTAQLLDSAEQWQTSEQDRAVLDFEREVVEWDHGNLESRAAWDSLMIASAHDVGSTIREIEALLPRLTATTARIEVQHRLALLYHDQERFVDAIQLLQAVWLEAVGSSGWADTEYVREDYGAVAYNLGQERLSAGDRVSALAYLLQSEETGFSGAARAAFDVALLLRNNPKSALPAAQRAEQGLGQLNAVDQVALLRYLVELYRRTGDRKEAQKVLARLTSL